MRRVVVMALGAVAAGGIVAAPALAGLTGNPSFSQQIPVPVPSQAKALTSQADDHGGSNRGPSQGTSGQVPNPGSSVIGVVAPSGAPVDDHGGASPSVEPSDGHGGSRGPGGGGGSGS